MLDGVDFPVRRWAITAAALDYGLDEQNRTQIDQIPDREYTDVYDVVVALSTTPAHLARRRRL